MSINDKIEQLEKAFENLKIIIDAYEKEKDFWKKSYWLCSSNNIHRNCDDFVFK